MFRHTAQILYLMNKKKIIDHLPVSLQTSRNFYKKSTRVSHRTKPKRSAGDMNRLGTSTTIYCSSTAKCSGAIVEDLTPGIHTVA